jgi:hypothetical protein
LFEKIVRAILNYFLHRGIKDSDISKLDLDLKKNNGKYVLKINSTTAVATKGEPIRKDTGSRNTIIVFSISLAITILLDVGGILLPDASLGRSLVFWGEFPAILVNIISARYIIRNLS